uniref:Uncharacterized protein n=1 Tax=Klebsiella pneumoniae TaxID=573 RepID=A0A2P1BPB1_KLEPN|nr:hypothetical protein [Klebsiella pneumoniae]
MVASVLRASPSFAFRLSTILSPGFVDRYAGNSPFARVNASLPPAASVSRPVWYGRAVFRSGPASLRVCASPSPF